MFTQSLWHSHSRKYNARQTSINPLKSGAPSISITGSSSGKNGAAWLFPPLPPYIYTYIHALTCPPESLKPSLSLGLNGFATRIDHIFCGVLILLLEKDSSVIFSCIITSLLPLSNANLTLLCLFQGFFLFLLICEDFF